jgi:hypothetical protein
MNFDEEKLRENPSALGWYPVLRRTHPEPKGLATRFDEENFEKTRQVCRRTPHRYGVASARKLVPWWDMRCPAAHHPRTKDVLDIPQFPMQMPHADMNMAVVGAIVGRRPGGASLRRCSS